MSEENLGEFPIKELEGKYDKYFKNPLRVEEDEPAEETSEPVYMGVPKRDEMGGYTPFSEATREEKIKLYKSLAGISAIGIVVAVFAIILVFTPKKDKEELKPKTRTVTRTVYVPEAKKPKEKETKPKVKEQPKDKDGNPIAEETEEGFDL